MKDPNNPAMSPSSYKIVLLWNECSGVGRLKGQGRASEHGCQIPTSGGNIISSYEALSSVPGVPEETASFL